MTNLSLFQDTRRQKREGDVRLDDPGAGTSLGHVDEHAVRMVEVGEAFGEHRPERVVLGNVVDQGVDPGDRNCSVNF